EHQRPAEVRAGVEDPHEQVGVGDRRVGAAPAEAGRAGNGAHAAGPDLDVLVLHAEDRAAADAGAGDVAHPEADRQTGDLAGVAFGDGGLLHHGDVGGGPTDVE